MKRIRLEVCPQPTRTRRQWKVTKAGAIHAQHNRQRDAIGTAVLLARQLAAAGEIVTLKIKGRHGRIREERTYPRSSDPRRTKG